MKTLRVRNFLRLQKVDLPIAGITLVAGRNSNGKSSLLDAAVCAYTQAPAARGVTRKNAAVQLVHDGKETGTIVLEEDDTRSFVINYPSCETHSVGEPWPPASALSIGGERFMSLTDRARTAAFSSTFGLDPTKEDFIQWFKDRPEAIIEPSRLEKLWTRIERDGWEPSHTEAKEYGAKLRGRWEEVTGRRYGVKIAQEWVPEGLMLGEDYDVPTAQAAAEKAKAELEVLVRAAGVGAAKRQELAQTKANGPEARRALNAADAEYAEMSANLDALLAEQNALPPIPGAAHDDSGAPCAWCGKPNRFTAVRNAAGHTYTFLEKPPAAPDPADVERITKQTDEIRARIAALRAALTSNEAVRMQEKRRIADAEAAARDLQRIESLPITDEAAVEAARAAVLRADRRFKAVDSLAKARTYAKQLADHAFIVDAYSPEGVRAMTVNRRMKEVNERLAGLSAGAGFEAVALDAELNGTLGGRSYLLNGESGRWRVDLILSVLFALEANSEVLLIDRLDVLEPQARTGVIKLVAGLKIPTLIMMMAKDAASAPDLAKAGIGKTVWIDDGNLSVAA